MKKTRLKGMVKTFSVDFYFTDINDILDIYACLMKGT